MRKRVTAKSNVYS